MLAIYDLTKLQFVSLAHALITGTQTCDNLSLVFVANAHHQRTRYAMNNRLQVQRTNTSIGDRGIQHAIEKNWNDMPAELRNLATEKISRQHFREQVREHLLEQSM